MKSTGSLSPIDHSPRFPYRPFNTVHAQHQNHRTHADQRHNGYTRIEAGPHHHPYGLFCVAPGHQLGFNDLKTIEVAEFLEAIAGGERRGPDFR